MKSISSSSSSNSTGRVLVGGNGNNAMESGTIDTSSLNRSRSNSEDVVVIGNAKEQREKELNQLRNHQLVSTNYHQKNQVGSMDKSGVVTVELWHQEQRERQAMLRKKELDATQNLRNYRGHENSHISTVTTTAAIAAKSKPATNYALPPTYPNMAIQTVSDMNAPSSTQNNHMDFMVTTPSSQTQSNDNEENNSIMESEMIMLPKKEESEEEFFVISNSGTHADNDFEIDPLPTVDFGTAVDNNAVSISIAETHVDNNCEIDPLPTFDDLNTHDANTNFANTDNTANNEDSVADLNHSIRKIDEKDTSKDKNESTLFLGDEKNFISKNENDSDMPIDTQYLASSFDDEDDKDLVVILKNQSPSVPNNKELVDDLHSNILESPVEKLHKSDKYKSDNQRELGDNDCFANSSMLSESQNLDICDKQTMMNVMLSIQFTFGYTTSVPQIQNNDTFQQISDFLSNRFIAKTPPSNQPSFDKNSIQPNWEILFKTLKSENFQIINVNSVTPSRPNTYKSIITVLSSIPLIMHNASTSDKETIISSATQFIISWIKSDIMM